MIRRVRKISFSERRRVLKASKANLSEADLELGFLTKSCVDYVTVIKWPFMATRVVPR